MPKLHDEAAKNRPTPNKEHLTVPLHVMEYLTTIRPQQESLRRFSYTPHSEAMPSLMGVHTKTVSLRPAPSTTRWHIKQMQDIQ
ncbi:hypothetical protein OS493_035202, partial [Desmophyllum pertusum]